MIQGFMSRFVASVMSAVFLIVSCSHDVFAAAGASSNLPAPTQLLKSSQALSYPVLKGLKIDPNNPLNLEFIIDTMGKETVSADEAQRLVNYFLTAVAVPQEDLWVNLSPYEKDRVVTDELGKTVLGEELLTQDYLLKQLSSSLTDPNSNLGKEYWSSVPSAGSGIGSETFNKIWIMPDKAQVYENGNRVFVTEATLKVMSDADYTAMQQNAATSSGNGATEKILPSVLKEVNEGERFAPTRQAYYSIILGLWFKEKLRDSFFKNYIDQKKVDGVAQSNPQSKEDIFNAYVASFKNGVYSQNVKMRENGKLVKRAYFSGGETYARTKVELAGSSVFRKIVGHAVFAAALFGPAKKSAADVLFYPDTLPQKVAAYQIPAATPDSTLISWAGDLTDFVKQAAAAHALKDRGNTSAVAQVRSNLVAPLIGKITSVDPDVVFASPEFNRLWALGDVAYDTFPKLLNDSTKSIDSRKFAADLVGRTGENYTSSFKVLNDFLTDSTKDYFDWYIKHETARGLGFLLYKHNKEAEALAYLDSKYWDYRFAGIIALMNYNKPEYASKFMEMLKEKDSLSLMEYSDLAGKKMKELSQSDFITWLYATGNKSLSMNPDPLSRDITYYILQYFVKNKMTQYAPLLEKLTVKSNTNSFGSMEDYFNALKVLGDDSVTTSLLEDGLKADTTDPFVGGLRYFIIEFAGLRGKEMHVPLLEQYAMMAHDTDLALYAVQALGDIGSMKAIPFLDSVIEKKNQKVNYQYITVSGAPYSFTIEYAKIAKEKILKKNALPTVGNSMRLKPVSPNIRTFKMTVPQSQIIKIDAKSQVSVFSLNGKLLGRFDLEKGEFDLGQILPGKGIGKGMHIIQIEKKIGASALIEPESVSPAGGVDLKKLSVESTGSSSIVLYTEGIDTDFLQKSASLTVVSMNEVPSDQALASLQ